MESSSFFTGTVSPGLYLTHFVQFANVYECIFLALSLLLIQENVNSNGILPICSQWHESVTISVEACHWAQSMASKHWKQLFPWSWFTRCCPKWWTNEATASFRSSRVSTSIQSTISKAWPRSVWLRFQTSAQEFNAQICRLFLISDSNARGIYKCLSFFTNYNLYLLGIIFNWILDESLAARRQRQKKPSTRRMLLPRNGPTLLLPGRAQQCHNDTIYQSN